MIVSGIREQIYQEKTDDREKVKKKKGDGFAYHLQKSYEEKCSKEEEVENAVYQELQTEQQISYSGIGGFGSIYGKGTISGGVLSKAVTQCESKNLSAKEADYVKNSIEQGYLLKAALSEDEKNVYIEQKMQDGTVKAYQVDLTKVQQDTGNPIEQTAIRCAQQGKKESVDDSWKEALEQFAGYVKDRIENGPPKFAIGASELSVEEWDKLLGSLDDTIEAVKEEQKQRLEKQERMEKEENILEEKE